jgi:hypothetical protein
VITAAMKNIAAIVQQVSVVAGGVSQVGKGVSQIATAAFAYEGTMARADALAFNKVLAKVQALIEDEMKRIEDILKKMDEGVSTMMQIFSDQAKTKDYINQQSAA